CGNGGEAERFVCTSLRRHAQAHPDGREAESGGDERERDQDNIELRETVLEFGDHRGGRVVRGLLPPSALHRCDAVENPLPTGDPEGRKGRGRRMFGERCSGGGERDRETGVQDVACDERGEFRRVQGSAVAFPKYERYAWGEHGNQPSREEGERLGR